MNKPSRTNEPLEGDGYNQSPNSLSNDLTTKEDLIGIANSRELRQEDPQSLQGATPPANNDDGSNAANVADSKETTHSLANRYSVIGQPWGRREGWASSQVNPPTTLFASHSPTLPPDDGSAGQSLIRQTLFKRVVNVFLKVGSFIGPGFMIAVSYSRPTPRVHISITCMLRPSFTNTHLLSS